MGILEIILIAVSLAMDALAVAICKGLSMKKMSWKKSAIVGGYFGIFQGLMPIIGYFLGTTFENFVTKIDHWITFGLLVIIGIDMLIEAFNGKEEKYNDNVDFKTMIVLAIATSVDALAVGITFAFLETNIIVAALIIAVITLVISLLGVKIGNKFGDKYGRKAETIGGLILILLGAKILLEHLKIL